jgi:long-chain acyl-CoA synthetase
MTEGTVPASPPISIADAHAQLTTAGSPFEIEVVDIDGRPTRTWKHALPSIRALLEQSRGHGDVPFIVYEDERTTFAEHYAQAAAFAAALVNDLGVQKGDRVAVAMRNLPEWPVAFFGAAATGAIVVPLNAWWTGPELEYGLSDSGTTVLVVDGERMERLADHLPNLPGLTTVVVRGDVPEGCVALADVVGDPDPANPPALPDVEIGPDDDATIFYTSGTTGHPKGALGTQRNFTTNIVSLGFAGARAAMRNPARQPTSSGGSAAAQRASLLSVPFFHATGSHSVLQGAMTAGSKLVLMHKWNPERALELIERERITNFGGVPTMVWQVLQSPDFERRDTSSVQGIGYGGAPAPPELVHKIEEMFPGRTPSNGYGLTETSSVTTSNGGADYLRRPDSVGVPVAVCEVKVVDELGNELPRGATGELWIKGPNVVRGYWGKPEATAQTFSDGWLHSGDVARIDEEGFVFIVDRAKDVIIRGGENVYCSEVEAALFEHPAVLDAAVIGVPHQVLGEEVGAVVQLKASHRASVEDLQAHVRERLAGFKVPVHVWFRDEDLPRNPAGKILKRDLRDEVLAT